MKESLRDDHFVRYYSFGSEDHPCPDTSNPYLSIWMFRVMLLEDEQELEMDLVGSS